MHEAEGLVVAKDTVLLEQEGNKQEKSSNIWTEETKK